MTPTNEQQAIIDHDQCLVVSACPGSGKTFTIATKIRRLVKQMKPFRGVIAISFTNKASRELKTRCLSDGADPKGSFFGTIDAFCLSEVLLPYLPHLFGSQRTNVEVADCNGIQAIVSTISNWDNLSLIEQAQTLWEHNTLELRTVAPLTLKLIESSNACQRYLAARYKWVFIDEYQDCDEHQHAIFLRLVELGIKGAAFGDPNQSIFGFAGKSSQYLMQLMNNDAFFKPFVITKNHRSHASIVHYAARLLSQSHQVPACLPPRILRVRQKGDESQVALWIGKNLDRTMSHFCVTNASSVAILVSSQRTQDIVKLHLGVPYKAYFETRLDKNSSPWALLFRRLLYWAYDLGETRLELIEEYALPTLRKAEQNKAKRWLEQLAQAVVSCTVDAQEQTFVSLARLFLPYDDSPPAVEALRNVLGDPEQLWSYKPPQSDQVQLMTLHKSKGLEFNIVFHLDLYEYILPKYKGNYLQDLNLHYVGITRAKDAVVLCASTRRTKANGTKIQAQSSEFFNKHGVNEFSATYESVVR